VPAVFAAWLSDVFPPDILTEKRVTGPATPVAVKVSGDPVSPDAVAVMVFAPAVLPRVHEPTVAIPEEFELAVREVPDPPPLATAKVIERPDTRFPPESVTTTDGAIATAEPAVAV
jgi:hypothetical protein